MAYKAIGYGGLPVFIGKRNQKGHGIGSIFASLARNALPMISSIGKRIAPSLLNTGANFLSDVVSGSSPKQAFKHHLKEGGKDIIKTISKKKKPARRKQKGGASFNSILGKRERSSPKLQRNNKKRKMSQMINMLSVAGVKGKPPGRKPKRKKQQRNTRKDIFS